MDTVKRLPLALFLLRLGVLLVMLMWTVDKFINPQHATAVYEGFYAITGLSESSFYIIGGLELLILAGFAIGFKKRFTYGAVLVFHAVSTLSAYHQYLSPFEGPNLLFYAAWPMLAACFALYYLRVADTILSVDK